MKETLLGKTLSELKEIASQEGLPAFAAKQMAQWLYQKHVTEIDAMTNLSKAARAALSERYEVGRVLPVECFTSRDGTRKYLFPTSRPDKYVETVMIPEYEDGSEGGMARATVCVSRNVARRNQCESLVGDGENERKFPFSCVAVSLQKRKRIEDMPQANEEFDSDESKHACPKTRCVHDSLIVR